MEEILFGSIIVWVLGRIVKKKADAPAPGTINLPKQGKKQQFPTPGSANYPTNNQGAGSPGGGRPGIL